MNTGLTEKQVKKEYESYKKYINIHIDPVGQLRLKFWHKLKNEYGLRPDEVKHIEYNIIYEIILKMILEDTDTIKDRFLYYANDLKRTKDMPLSDYRAIIAKEYVHLFYNQLKETGIDFIILEYIPEQTVTETRVKNKHGTGTRIVATGLFGIFGLAGTGGVKTQTYNRTIPGKYIIKEIFKVKEVYTGLVIQEIDENGEKPIKELNWNNIIGMDNDFNLNITDAKPILLSDFDDSTIQECIENIYLKKIRENNPLRDNIDFNKMKNLTLKVFRKYINTKSRGKQTNSTYNEAQEIENFYNLKEKGIITEEEFEKKKKQILNRNPQTLSSDMNQSDNSINAENQGNYLTDLNNNENKQYCPNCGIEIPYKDAKFCQNCGFQIK